MRVPPGTSAPSTPAPESPNGASPARRSLRTWAGRGTGVSCNTCGTPIGEKDIEYEVEVQPGSRHTLHFHFNCYQDWVAGRWARG